MCTASTYGRRQFRQRWRIAYCPYRLLPGDDDNGLRMHMTACLPRAHQTHG